VPIYDFAIANEELADEETKLYYPCCGKSICKGCVHAVRESGNALCPFCNSNQASKTDEDRIEEMTKRTEANDAASIWLMADSYRHGLNGIQQDRTTAVELYAKAADLGHSDAHNNLADVYCEGGNLKKAKFHWEAAAMAGHEGARFNLGIMDLQSGNIEQAVKHWTIAASAGHYKAMFQLKICFEKGLVSRESIDSTLVAYNDSCAEMRSKNRDAYIRTIMERQRE
jgi:TPR repeat protein